MPPHEIQRIVVAGAGTIGQYIALHGLRHNFDVCLYDVNPEALQSAAENQRRRQQLFRYGESVVAENVALLEALGVETRLETAARNCDLLIEAIPEKLALKRKLLARFHEVCPQTTLFTTTTSSFLPSEMAQASGRPRQFAALHFLLECDIVEIMGHPQTDAELLDRLDRFSRDIGHIPIRCHEEQRGYLFNTMVMSLNYAAIGLAANGVASIADIDRVWMRSIRTSVGPFGLLDMVGLDTAAEITRYFSSLSRDPQAIRNAEFLSGYVAEGRLGMKSGHGFYKYPNPSYQSENFIRFGESP